MSECRNLRLHTISPLVAMLRLFTLACLVCVTAISLLAAVDLNAPIPSVRLADGRELKNVVVLSFASSSLVAKWEGGRGVIAYGQLPKDVAEAAAAFRPPPPPTAPSPRVAQTAEDSPKASAADDGKYAYKGQAFITEFRGRRFRISDAEVFAVEPAEFRRFMSVRSTSDLALARGRPVSEYHRDEEYAKKLRRDAINKAMFSSLGHAMTSVAQTTTDGDGNFSFTCSKPEVIVFVRSLYEIGGGHDCYCFAWAIKAKAGKTLNLTMTNMLDPEQD